MSEEPKKAEAPAAEPAAGSSGGGSKIVLILTAVNLVVTLAIVGVLFVSFKKESEKPNIEDIVAADGHGGGEEHGGGGEHGAEGGGEHGAPKADAHGGGGEKKESTLGHEYGKMLQLEEFVINLATVGTVAPKYARVKISVEVPVEDTELELTQKMPQVRNTIIDLFNSKRAADLATVEGRNFLKDEIRTALNSFLVTGKVKEVFFTTFNLAG